MDAESRITLVQKILVIWDVLLVNGVIWSLMFLLKSNLIIK